jgi:carboxylesterase type B
MVQVSFNYRNGISAWMSLQGLTDRDPAFPKRSGNYGLGDIVTALSWIKIYIRSFGGDPNRILVVGHDKNAATNIAALSLSTRSINLFNAVMVSTNQIC